MNIPDNLTYPLLTISSAAIGAGIAIAVLSNKMSTLASSNDKKVDKQVFDLTVANIQKQLDNTVSKPEHNALAEKMTELVDEVKGLRKDLTTVRIEEGRKHEE